MEDEHGMRAFFPNITFDEAQWALSVIIKRGITVHPHEDEREERLARMMLIPELDLLDAGWHPDAGQAIVFQEEIVLHHKKPTDVVVQVARRDMPKGEPVLQYPGRFSNSELTARYGISFGQRNPLGIDSSITMPSEWPENPRAPIRKEYSRLNCTSRENFQFRFSKGGRPSRSFVRCWRVGWLLTQGWYAPQIIKKKLLLEKWPPPKRYEHEDWLAWTQADMQLVKHVVAHCDERRRALKRSIDSEQASDFKYSKDPVDKKLYTLRGFETVAYKNCLSKLKHLATPNDVKDDSPSGTTGGHIDAGNSAQERNKASETDLSPEDADDEFDDEDVIDVE